MEKKVTFITDYKVLIHNNIIPTLSNSEEGAFENILATSIFFLPTMFSALSETEIIVLTTFNLLSAHGVFSNQNVIYLNSSIKIVSAL